LPGRSRAIAQRIVNWRGILGCCRRRDDTLREVLEAPSYLAASIPAIDSSQLEGVENAARKHNRLSSLYLRVFREKLRGGRGHRRKNEKFQRFSLQFLSGWLCWYYRYSRRSTPFFELKL
jgi:hypothetical protein